MPSDKPQSLGVLLAGLKKQKTQMYSNDLTFALIQEVGQTFDIKRSRAQNDLADVK